MPSPAMNRSGKGRSLIRKARNMQVQVRTDNQIEGNAGLIEHVEREVTESLERFGRQITRVEAHFSDIDGPKSIGDDKRCKLEARIAGRKPLVVSHEGSTLNSALDGALVKLERTLDHTFGRLYERKGRTPFSGPEEE
jgi:ribosome-associated translation inhibitor RaiA